MANSWPLVASRTESLPSRAPRARSLPSSENAARSAAVGVCQSSEPLAVSKARTPSSLRTTTRRASRETASTSPWIRARGSKVLRSQAIASLSQERRSEPLGLKRTFFVAPRVPASARVATAVLFSARTSASWKETVSWSVPAANAVSFASNAIERTPPCWRTSSRSCSTSQTRSSPAMSAETTTLPSPEIATAVTGASWPRRRRASKGGSGGGVAQPRSASAARPPRKNLTR